MKFPFDTAPFVGDAGATTAKNDAFIVLLYSVGIMIMSAAFYIWAVVNTITFGFDIGIVCFAIYFVSGVTGFYTSQINDKKFSLLHMVALAIGVLSILFSYSFALVLFNTCDEASEGCKELATNVKLAIPLVAWVLTGAVFLVFAYRYHRALGNAAYTTIHDSNQGYGIIG